jgi:hypothetical protein
MLSWRFYINLLARDVAQKPPAKLNSPFPSPEMLLRQESSVPSMWPWITRKVHVAGQTRSVAGGGYARNASAKCAATARPAIWLVAPRRVTERVVPRLVEVNIASSSTC